MNLTGRAVYSKKDLVDEALAIDILELQRKGLFEKGPAYSWTCQWRSNGERTNSIGYSLENRYGDEYALRLQYTSTNHWENKKQDLDYRVALDTTPCNYGGHRWWFICPLSQYGIACNRRCRIIYLPPGQIYFGCRECYALTYECRQQHRNRFYENYGKYLDKVEKAEQILKTSQSWKKKRKAMQMLQEAEAALDRFSWEDALYKIPKNKK